MAAAEQQQRAAALPQPNLPVTRKRGLRPFTFAALMAAGFLAFSLLSIRSAVEFRTPIETSVADIVPAPIAEFDGLEVQISARVAIGQAGIYSFNARTASRQSDLLRFAAERNEVLNLRQRLSQARLLAEYEGRWPTTAAGRSLNRGELKDLIDRTDQWLKEYDSTVNAAEKQLTRCGIAVGQADRILLAMQRLDEELKQRSMMEQTGDELKFRQEAQTKFKALSAQFDQVMNDSALKSPRLNLLPFKLDP